jgi:hypothetical protein
MQETWSPGLHYSAQLHGSHADFCQSQDFQLYKKQVRENLFFLTEFCWEHGMSDVDSVAGDFDTFLKHRFESHHYFDTRAEIIDTAGKRSLDEFCWMIRHDAMDLEKKKAAIGELSKGLSRCADDAVSSLVGVAKAYLMENLSDLGRLGAGFSDEDRQQLLARMLRMDLGRAIPGLVHQWAPDPAARVDMVYALLHSQAMPGLHQAMLQEDANAAVDAWYQPLRDSALMIFAGPRLADLLATPHDNGSSPLAHALATGHPAGVGAFFTLLKDLLRNPDVRSNIGERLPDLLFAEDWYGAPALSLSMAHGATATVTEYYTGLAHLLADPELAGSIRPRLLEVLPGLLVAQKDTVDSGLAYALGNGHAAVIEVLHGMLASLLNTPGIAPSIQPALPHMLAAKDGEGRLGVSNAHDHGHDAAIYAFGDLLLDPAIEPYIGQPLSLFLSGGDAGI